LRTLATWAFGIGIAVGFVAYNGWLRWLPPSAANFLFVVAGVGLFGGGAVLGVAWLYDRYRDRFPTSERREALVNAAMSLGLRSMELDTSTLGLGFRFLQGRGRGYFAENFDRWWGSLTRPRFQRVFVGSWRGMEVSIFDYTDQHDDTDREWTCATLPLGRSLPELEISRRDAVTGRLGLRFDRGFRSGDESFDRTFRVKTSDPVGALAALDPRARAQLLDKAPPSRCLVEVAADRLLICGGRIPPEDRRLIVDAATAVREALAPATP